MGEYWRAENAQFGDQVKSFQKDIYMRSWQGGEREVILRFHNDSVLGPWVLISQGHGWVCGGDGGGFEDFPIPGPVHMLTCNHCAVLNLSFSASTRKMATKWPYNESPGLILGAVCTICRACPVGAGLGAKFGREMTEKCQNLNYKFCFLA